MTGVRTASWWSAEFDGVPAPSDSADELKELADTFDTMLKRLDHAFNTQRRFIANASHELRTPLTLNRALIEVAAHRPAAPPEVRQLGATLLEINSRHERLIDGLLTLAQSERDLDERSYVDLADVAEQVVAQLPAGEVTVQDAGHPAARRTHGVDQVLVAAVHLLHPRLHVRRHGGPRRALLPGRAG